MPKIYPYWRQAFFERNPLTMNYGGRWRIDITIQCRQFDIVTRTQIQLPDALYKRAKAFAAEREISLAEIARRGIELFLARFPETAPPKKWELPKVHCGGIKVPLEQLHDITSDEETFRSFPR